MVYINYLQDYYDSLIGQKNLLKSIDKAEELSSSLKDRYRLIIQLPYINFTSKSLRFLIQYLFVTCYFID